MKIGKNKTLINRKMRGSNVIGKQQRGDRQPLWDANGTRRKYLRGALEQEAAGQPRQNRSDPGHKGVVDHFRPQGGAEDISVAGIKAIFNVKEQGTNFEGQALESAICVSKSGI